MPVITTGNAINSGSFSDKQGTLIGGLQYITVVGYVDIPSTNVAGPLPWVVENPSKMRADTSGIVVPNPHRRIQVGIKVPATNLAGQAATLIGTNAATFRNGEAADDAAGAIVTFSGTSQGAIETVVTTPYPAATAEANTFQFYTSANIRSSVGTMRVYGLVMYALAAGFPNVEEVVQIEAPVYSY
jgi:hypothetical protein